MAIKNILIMGAGHGIGLSLVKKSIERFTEAKIFASYRLHDRAHELLSLANENLISSKVDPSLEEDISSLKEKILEYTEELDLVIMCMGVLDSESSLAEKRIDDVKLETMMHAFKANSLSHALSVKHLKPLLRKKNKTVLAHLSARVGSIKENELGGWYSYRMSKASLNMLVKNLDLEFRRSQFNCSVLAIHPGTTHTELSQKYLKSVKYKIYSSDETAEHILDLTENIDETASGKFLQWDGSEIEW